MVKQRNAQIECMQLHSNEETVKGENTFCLNQMPKEKPGGDEKKLPAACSTEENPRLKYC